MAKTRIVLIDDHPLLRSGVRALIATQSDLEVVGEAGDAAGGLAAARATQPDLCVLDLGLPDRSGIATLRELCRLPRPPRVLVFSLHDQPAVVRAALAAGAAAYVVKAAANQDLLTAIRAVVAGRIFVDATVLPELSPAGVVPVPLSARETQVLALLARGQTNRQIAEHLGIGVKSIETYRARLSQKLGLRGRAALVRFAHQSGFASTDMLPLE